MLNLIIVTCDFYSMLVFVLHLQLEEFRNKKKAAAKKAVSSNSAPSANGDVHETKPLVSDNIHVTADSDSGSGFHVGKNDKKTINAHEAEPHVDHDALHAPQEELKNNKIGFNAGYGMDTEKRRDDIHINSNHFSNTRLEDALTNDRLKDFSTASPVTTHVSVTKSSSERSHGANYIDPVDGPTYRGTILVWFGF